MRAFSFIWLRCHKCIVQEHIFSICYCLYLTTVSLPFMILSLAHDSPQCGKLEYLRRMEGPNLDNWDQWEARWSPISASLAGELWLRYGPHLDWEKQAWVCKKSLFNMTLWDNGKYILVSTPSYWHKNSCNFLSNKSIRSIFYFNI